MKKKNGIPVLLALICFLILLIGGLVMSHLYLNNARASFREQEASLPESAISNYLESVRKKEYDQIYENSQLVAPHFNSKEDYIAKLNEIYSNVDMKKIEFAPVESHDGTIRYALASDGKYLATLDLLESENGYIASTIFSGDNDYTIEVPTGYMIRVNGVLVTSANLADRDVVASNYYGLSDRSQAPHIDRFVIKNLIGKPTIEVDGYDGFASVSDVLSNTIYVGRVPTDNELETTLIEYAKTCARFPAKEGSIADIRDISITNSDWYSRISTLQNEWFTAHNASSFSNERAFDIVMLSDTAAIGNVSFDYFADNGTVSRTWNSGYQISLLKQNGVWKIAGFGIDSSLNPQSKEATNE